MTYATKQALVAALKAAGYSQLSDGDWYPTGTYYLAHGEYSQPDYSVRRYCDGWDLHATYYYYPGTFGAPADGRVSAADLLAAVDA